MGCPHFGVGRGLSASRAPLRPSFCSALSPHVRSQLVRTTHLISAPTTPSLLGSLRGMVRQLSIDQFENESRRVSLGPESVSKAAMGSPMFERSGADPSVAKVRRRRGAGRGKEGKVRTCGDMSGGGLTHAPHPAPPALSFSARGCVLGTHTRTSPLHSIFKARPAGAVAPPYLEAVRGPVLHFERGTDQ